VAAEKGRLETLERVLREIENFMIDLKSVHLLEKLNDERGWDGLSKIAMHHEGEERVPAVRALARLGKLVMLETIAGCQPDPIVASAAVIELARRAVFAGYDRLGDPYSNEIYKLGRLVTEANTLEARNVALAELGNIAVRDDPLGKAAKNELRKLSAEGVNIMKEELLVRRTMTCISAAIEKAPENPTDDYKTGAWWAWNSDKRLQRLTNDIEILAGEL
ncbi:MAG: hypothetical protein V1909_03565, partial [Candidatus Micrarchaeota archaeon]